MPISEISYVLVTSWYGLTCRNLIPGNLYWAKPQNAPMPVSGAGSASLRTGRGRPSRGSSGTRGRRRPRYPGPLSCAGRRWPRAPGDERLATMADDGVVNADTGESLPARWNALGPGSNMWMNWEDDPRNAGTEGEGERETLLEYLRAYRLTLELKCADLDAEQLARRSVPPSTMSLLGLVRHMADVERNWFRRVMAGQDAPPLYWSDEAADADWAGAVADPAVVAEAWQSWRDEVGFAERFVADADDLGIRGTMRDGSSVALR